MHRACEHLLAGTGFAGDQDRRTRRRREADPLERKAHLRIERREAGSVVGRGAPRPSGGRTKGAAKHQEVVADFDYGAIAKRRCGDAFPIDVGSVLGIAVLHLEPAELASDDRVFGGHPTVRELQTQRSLSGLHAAVTATKLDGRDPLEVDAQPTKRQVIAAQRHEQEWTPRR